MTEILTLLPNWGFQQTNKIKNNRVKLGDGYSLDITISDSQREEWSITGNGLSNADVETYINFIESHGGVTPFFWRPVDYVDYKTFWCTSFSVVNDAPGLWKISLTIQESG